MLRARTHVFITAIVTSSCDQRLVDQEVKLERNTILSANSR
jgi:hypothetical protein